MSASLLPSPTLRKAGAAQAWVLIFAMFLPIMAIIALAPALPTLMGRFKDVPNASTVVPMLLTVPSLCIALTGGLAGLLTDKFGRRRLLLAAMFVYFIGGVGPFLSNTFSDILLSRILLGIAEAFVLAIGNALLADYFAQEDRNKWLMIQGIVGPFMATGLLSLSGRFASYGWRMPFLLYGLTVPILIGAFFWIFEPQRQEPINQTNALAKSKFPVATVAVICAITFFTSILYFVQPIQYSLVLQEIGVKDATLIGNISAVASLTVPVGAFVFKRNASWSMPLKMALVYLLMGVGLVGMGALHDYHWSAVAALFQQTAAGMTVPTFVAWVLSRMPGEHRGRGMGFWAAAFFIGQFCSPIAVGLLRGLVGGLLPVFILSGGICLAAAFTSLILARKQQTI